MLLSEVIFGFFAWRAWMRLTGRVDYRAVARARAWGDLAVTSAEVERELQMGVKAKSKALDRDAELCGEAQRLGFDLFRLENLVWAYKKTVKRRIYIYSGGDRLCRGAVLQRWQSEVAGKEKKVDEVLTLAGERAPWAAKGYSDDLQKAYKKRKDGLVAEVMKRKQEMGR